MKRHVKKYDYCNRFCENDRKTSIGLFWAAAIGVTASIGAFVAGGGWISLGVIGAVISLSIGAASGGTLMSSCTLREDYTYIDGMKEGKYRYYHENGKLSLKENYHAGLLEGPFEEYFVTGSLWKKGSYRADQLHGPYVEYYEGGQLFEKCTYVNGKKDGPCVKYHENGRLKMRGTFKRGKEDGMFEFYHDNGSLGEERVYRNGYVLQGVEAEAYLKEFRAARIVQEMDNDSRIIDLRDRLAHLTDKKYYKEIGRARTPERQRKVIDLMHMRRGAELVARVLRRAKADGDEEMVMAVSKIAEPIRAEESTLRKEVSRKRKLMKIARRHNEGKQE